MPTGYKPSAATPPKRSYYYKSPFQKMPKNVARHATRGAEANTIEIVAIFLEAGWPLSRPDRSRLTSFETRFGLKNNQFWTPKVTPDAPRTRRGSQEGAGSVPEDPNVENSR